MKLLNFKTLTKGFSLIEVVVSLLILSITFTALILLLFNRSVFALKSNSPISRAFRLVILILALTIALRWNYVVAGFVFAMQKVDTEELVWGLMAVYLSGIGLQGFREDTEAPWRRGFGTFGAIISLFFLSMAIDTEIFRYMTWMFIGIVAFGFGILYMNRLGEVSQLYDMAGQANPPAEDLEQEPKKQEEELTTDDN